jgi:transcriptional regulator with XRE-family HTH domain
MGTIQTQPVGQLLRQWRNRRHLSQLDLACDADISTRHLSFLETGRSQPSRDMLIHLAEQLEIPLRDRNVLLTAAGYAPVFLERPLESAALEAARKAIDLVLTGHEPYPALAIDRHWSLVAANRAIAPLLAGVDAQLLNPPVNVLRLSLHPQGLAPRIANLPEWRAHLLARLRREIELTADPILAELLKELSAYPVDAKAHRQTETADYHSPVVPFQLATESGILSFISTTTVFGTPIDITLSEIALESFFPADAATADALRAIPL